LQNSRHDDLKSQKVCEFCQGGDKSKRESDTWLAKMFGCRPAAVVAQPGMGTASRAAAVVHQYGHFRRTDHGLPLFSTVAGPGAWMLAAPTIYAAARSPHGTTLDRPIPQSSSVKKKTL
jgi:hypothetical protein